MIKRKCKYCKNTVKTGRTVCDECREKRKKEHSKKTYQTWINKKRIEDGYKLEKCIVCGRGRRYHPKNSRRPICTKCLKSENLFILEEKDDKKTIKKA